MLDFRNDAETIRLAFAPYYESTDLSGTTDPNLIYDLQSKLAGEGIYTDQEAENVAAISLKYGAGSERPSQMQLLAALNPPVDRFKKRWLAAEDAKDKEELDKLTLFHKNLGTFCRLYDFLTQIVNYDDGTLERCYIFFRYLEPLVRPDRIRVKIDLSGVVLTHHKLRSGTEIAIDLETVAREDRLLKPATDVGTGVARDPERVKMDELVQKLNDLFDDGSLTDADTVGMFNHVAGKMLAVMEESDQASPSEHQSSVSGESDNHDGWNGRVDCGDGQLPNDERQAVQRQAEDGPFFGDAGGSHL